LRTSARLPSCALGKLILTEPELTFPLLAINSKLLHMEVSPSFAACKNGVNKMVNMSNNAFIGQNAT
jgi:hypothetical protein